MVGAPTTYGWDTDHGWRTSARASGETSVAYSYTGTGRLASYSDPNRTVAATYEYDAAGQRTRSVVTSGSVTTETRYIYEGLSLLSLAATETVGSSVRTYSVTYLTDASGSPYAGLYASAGATAVPFTTVATDRGDIVELRDSSGTPFAAYRYDAWGSPLSVTSTGTSSIDAGSAAAIAARQPLRYAGYCWDEHSGCYYLSARTYDPTTRQFLTKDPAKADGEESAYQYCGGDPIGKVDPSGLWGHKMHRDLTTKWAREEGFLDFQATQIANGDMWVDDRRSMYSGEWWTGRSRYHFYVYGAWLNYQSFGRSAVSEWKAGRQWGALWILGQALHCGQDRWGHLGLFLHGSDWAGDYWDKNPGYSDNYRRTQTELFTRQATRSFRKAVGL